MIYSPETKKSVERSTHAGTLLGAFSLLASGAGTVENQPMPISQHDTYDDRVTVHVEHNAKSDTIVNYFMGYRQQMIPVKNAVQPFLHEAGTVRYFSFRGGYYSDAALEDAILESAIEDDGMVKKVVGVSNGGKEALYQYAKPEIQQQVPYIESWNMDSSPGDFSDIRWLYRKILASGEILNHNMGMHQRLFLAAMNLGLGKLDQNGTSAKDLAFAVTHSTANTPLGPSQSQLLSLIRPLPDHESMTRLGLHIGEVNYVASVADPVVDTHSSHARIQASLEHPVNFVVDPNRPRKNHAGITDTPQFFAGIVKNGIQTAIQRKELTDA